MRKIVILVLVLLAAVGCAPAARQFTLTVEPPDSKIDVVQGSLPGTSYHSPALISIPTDNAIAAQSRLIISHKSYKTTVLLLSSVHVDNLKIRLQKAPNLYNLKYSLIAPARSDDLIFEDKILTVKITPRDDRIDLRIDNLTQRPLTIEWDKADYSDVMRQTRRIILSRINLENRGNRIPPQIIPVGGSLQESVLPENAVAYAGKEKGYVVKPLFELDSESALSLKGKIVSIFLPVVMDGALIPDYNFRIRIEDVIKNTAP